MRPPLALGVLASGEGTTFEGLAAALAGEPDRVRFALLLSDRPGARVLDRGRSRGVPTLEEPYLADDVDAWAGRITADLETRGVELVVLAGFLPILPSSWVSRWRGRALNLHPSLLPRYGGRGMYGRRIHEAVLAAGDRETGVTVHLVTGDVDAGPSVAQERVAVLPGDTPDSLRERLRPAEVRVLVTTIRRFADGSLPLPYREADERARDASSLGDGANSAAPSG
jgi:phosphoribosylglycinamide formyltransferase 1